MKDNYIKYSPVWPLDKNCLRKWKPATDLLPTRIILLLHIQSQPKTFSQSRFFHDNFLTLINFHTFPRFPDTKR